LGLGSWRLVVDESVHECPGNASDLENLQGLYDLAGLEVLVPYRSALQASSDKPTEDWQLARRDNLAVWLGR
jgi:hypothetical protein